MKSKLFILAASALLLSACGGTPSSSSEVPSSSPEASSSAATSSEPATTSSSESVPASSSEAHVRVERDFKGRIATLSDPDTVDVELDFHYDSDYLESDPALENKPLALMAFGLANASANANRAREVFASAGLDEHLDVSALEPEPTYDSIGYAIASRKLNGAEQVVVSVRGDDYGDEWVSNFYAVPDVPTPDDNGDHYGMRYAAKKVIAGVKAFVEQYGIKNPRYLFTGYSRGGGVASLAAAMMVDENPTGGNVYGYTFEAPAVMAKKNDIPAYGCIFNYVNENDFIPMVMPDAFGFTRPGKTIHTAAGITAYAEVFEQYGLVANDADESADFTALGLTDAEGNPLGSGKDAFSFIFGGLLRKLSESEVAKGVTSYHTKEDYVTNLQPHVLKMIEIFMENDLMSRFDMDKAASVAFDLVGFLGTFQNQDGFDEQTAEDPYDPDALYPIVKKLLATMGVYLDDTDPSEIPPDSLVLVASPIKAASAAVQAVMRSLYMFLTQHYIDSGLDIDTARGMFGTLALVLVGKGKAAIARHYQDTTYVVLRRYVEQTNAE